jgi:hypothetical protein
MKSFLIIVLTTLSLPSWPQRNPTKSLPVIPIDERNAFLSNPNVIGNIKSNDEGCQFVYKLFYEEVVTKTEMHLSDNIDGYCLSKC